MQKWARCRDEAANHQLPRAVAFWIIQIVSTEECSSLTQNLMQICCSAHSVILNVTATQYTCSLNGVYHIHWLVQWSHHCSHTHISVHSPWLPGYLDVAQTVLIILTMVGLFPDRPCIIIFCPAFRNVWVIMIFHNNSMHHIYYKLSKFLKSIFYDISIDISKEV